MTYRISNIYEDDDNVYLETSSNFKFLDENEKNGLLGAKKIEEIKNYNREEIKNDAKR